MSGDKTVMLGQYLEGVETTRMPNSRDKLSDTRMVQGWQLGRKVDNNPVWLEEMRDKEQKMFSMV